MKLIIEGEPKEIAALVLATQERRVGADISPLASLVAGLKAEEPRQGSVKLKSC